MGKKRKREGSSYEKELELYVRAKNENRILLKSKPNVIALDVGYRLKNGEVTDELVVKVYVSRKLPARFLSEDDIIPSTITIDDEEIPVDIEEKSMDKPHLFTLRTRPLAGGASIGPANPRLAGTGTLGVCLTRNDGDVYVLSCDHVIGDVAGLAVGDPIVQPSLGDGGATPADEIGSLADFVGLDFGTTTITILGLTITVPNVNYVDAALGLVTGAFNGGNREIHWVGYPSFRRASRLSIFERLSLMGRRVVKMGRTTEFSIGRIRSVFYDTWVGPYANGQNAWFEDQIRIEGTPCPFSRPGDSGSLVLDSETNEPLGLLFAGSGCRSVANPIDEVMRRLDIPQL